MGQSFCKDCEGKFKRPAFVAASNEDGGTSSYSCEDTSDTVGSLRSSPSNGADLNGPTANVNSVGKALGGKAADGRVAVEVGGESVAFGAGGDGV